MKTNNKLTPKVKTLFHFAKKRTGNQIAPSDTTTTTVSITVTHVPVNNLF